MTKLERAMHHIDWKMAQFFSLINEYVITVSHVKEAVILNFKVDVYDSTGFPNKINDIKTKSQDVILVKMDVRFFLYSYIKPNFQLSEREQKIHRNNNRFGTHSNLLGIC